SAEWVRGLSALGWGGSIGSLWFTAVIVELVMVCRSVSRPASGRFAVNQWTQLTLTPGGGTDGRSAAVKGGCVHRPLVCAFNALLARRNGRPKPDQPRAQARRPI